MRGRHGGGGHALFDPPDAECADIDDADINGDSEWTSEGGSLRGRPEDLSAERGSGSGKALTASDHNLITLVEASQSQRGGLSLVSSLDIWRTQLAPDEIYQPSAGSLGLNGLALEIPALIPANADDRLLRLLHFSLSGTPHSWGRRRGVLRLWTSSATLVGILPPKK